MSHLLMIESWVGGTARILPEAILAAGHRYTFVARRPEHFRDGHGSAVEHPVLAHACRIVQCETNDVDSLIALLAREHEADPFDGVLTICDYYLETVVRVAEALALPHPFPRHVALERRKDRVRAAIDAAGVENPGYAVTSSLERSLEAANALGYPVVLKPTDLASSAYVRLVSDEQTLARAYTELRAFERNFRDQPREPVCLIEQYIAGPELSVEACTVDGVTTVLGITDKSVTGEPYFIEDGHMFPAALEPHVVSALSKWAERVLRAVGHDRGIAHIEVKLSADGPRLIELNPRMPGNYIVELIREVTGVDLLRATIDLALGLTPQLARVEGTARSAAIAFLVPPRGGTLRSIAGVDTLRARPQVVRWHVPEVAGSVISAPIDNACYLGHVMTRDPDGLGARAAAEQALRGLEVVYEA